LPHNPLEVRPDLRHVNVRRSGVHGRGLFAARDIGIGERVLQYGGLKISKKESDKRTDAQWGRGRVYTFELNKQYDLDGSPPWNLARLANHSCDPNCESVNDRGRAVWIVSIRNIRRGDEISYDYNFPLVDPPPVCRCGSPKCRGYIIGKEYTPKLRRWLEETGNEPGPGLKPRKKTAPKPRRR